MNQNKRIPTTTYRSLTLFKKEVRQYRNVLLKKIISVILQVNRPRVCPGTGRCGSALAHKLTVGKVGRAVGGSAGGKPTR